MSEYRLLPEWAPQSAVLLTWPHENTDWQDRLTKAESVYVTLALAICQHAHLLIAAPAEAHAHIRQLLEKAGIEVDEAGKEANKVTLYDVNSNDTWARDHGPLTVAAGEKCKLLDFVFNGWGGKFEAALDNQISRKLAEQGAFTAPLESVDIILEGGALEIDEQGTLISTRACLLNRNRNPQLSEQDVERFLREQLGATKINWLDYGYLAGDDTDSHIDTLARLGPDRVLVFQGCDDKQDEHYNELKLMKQQLSAMTNSAGEAYRLFELPWPQAVYSEDGHRLPATYANFLILNGSVLVPVYGDVNDAKALAVIGEAFAGFNIIGIDCRTLIEQHGSLHCITMQLPVGVIDANNP